MIDNEYIFIKLWQEEEKSKQLTPSQKAIELSDCSDSAYLKSVYGDKKSTSGVDIAEAKKQLGTIYCPKPIGETFLKGSTSINAKNTDTTKIKFKIYTCTQEHLTEINSSKTCAGADDIWTWLGFL